MKTMNTTALSQEFKGYSRSMAKIGIYGSTLDTLNDGSYDITLTTKTWYRGERKAFSKNPQVTETGKISARQYACYVSSVGFFRDRVNKAYTAAGFIPVRLTCYSPDRAIKIERVFCFALDTGYLI
jgi:hypothetical protein